MVGQAIITRTLILVGILLLGFAAVFGQGLGAGTIQGTVVDPNEAAVPNATVTLANPITGYSRTATCGPDGSFRFDNVPPNNYQLNAAADGFDPANQTLSVKTSVPISVKLSLAVAGTNATVTIDSGASNVIENDPSSHTDVNQTLIERLPQRSVGNGMSDVVTLAAPGVVADSNGSFHPLGDHGETSYSLDNQPISDQQSKAFSTQIPVNAVQSVEVITGATPAEYGDKTSLVVNATTHSGLNQKRPSGSFNALYGSFGSSSVDGTLGYGNAKLGNFAAFNFARSGRFLDPPEITSLHNRGRSVNIFDRLDYNPNEDDTFHLNLFLARNRFETPNDFTQNALGQDQSQLVNTVNLALGYVHIFSPTTVLSVNPYYRVDSVKYFASVDPFSDEPITFDQSRRLNNVGIRTDLSYVKGKHNAKFGIQFSHTFLNEGFQFAITDPDFNDPVSPDFVPGLLPFDLARGGNYFRFRGHTDIKQEALYAQDNITLGNATLSLGLRYDNYHGLTHDQAIQPRLGISYHVKRTNTILRGSYTRNFETPYNENLILSSVTGAGGLANGVFGDVSNQPLKAGNRNQFNVGFQQSLGKYIMVDGDYFYKRTNNAYDFNALFNTSVTFPIGWQMSKLDGVSMRVNLTNYHGLTAFMVAGHTRARFFPPESGGLFFNSDLPTGVFRIDHDQAFQQTTQVQYQFEQWKNVAPYLAMTWRYDSGQVSGEVPDYATALTFTADQQAQIGLFCGSTFATPTQAITTCSDPNRGALRIRFPPGVPNDDTNPARIAPRNLFDLSAGTDNLLRTDRTHLTLRFTVANLTNKIALYNFLSTFSGTHFVSPRSYQAQIGLTF
ncbi:MAG: TonB-dependent receptor [Pyrinomonadaceae bacterium]